MSETSPLEYARILIVDDVAEWREIAGAVLRASGAVVDEARNGEEAFQHLSRSHIRHEPYRLIVLDLMMPAMNGYRLLDHIRGHPAFKAIPVIVVTTEADTEGVRVCQQRGVAGYLLKPFKVARLREMAERILPESDPEDD